MRYKTSEDLDRAIKAAAKASPLDTGRAYAGFSSIGFSVEFSATPTLAFCSKEGWACSRVRLMLVRRAT